MVDPVRVFAYTSFFGSMLAWSIVAPEHMAAVAEEPLKAAAATIDTLFPPTVDPKVFRHYDFTFDDSISTEMSRTQVVKKIGRGVVSQVTVVTTPSGTYSSDGMASPHVLYPGIERSKKRWPFDLDFSQGGSWASYSDGSFTYLVFRTPDARI